MLTVASTPSAGCEALCVQVLRGRPPDDRVHVAASPYTCDIFALTYLTRLGVYLCVGVLCLLQGCIALGFGLVSLGLHCFT